MPLVSNYSVLFYGGSDSCQIHRAEIKLSDADGRYIASILFNDSGLFCETDVIEKGVVKMHLPSAIFQSVLDVLRNEKPIKISFSKEQGRGFLGTSVEPVGEGE